MELFFVVGIPILGALSIGLMLRDLDRLVKGQADIRARLAALEERLGHPGQ